MSTRDPSYRPDGQKLSPWFKSHEKIALGDWVADYAVSMEYDGQTLTLNRGGGLDPLQVEVHGGGGGDAPVVYEISSTGQVLRASDTDATYVINLTPGSDWVLHVDTETAYTPGSRYVIQTRGPGTNYIRLNTGPSWDPVVTVVQDQWEEALLRAGDIAIITVLEPGETPRFAIKYIRPHKTTETDNFSFTANSYEEGTVVFNGWSGGQFNINPFNVRIGSQWRVRCNAEAGNWVFVNAQGGATLLTLPGHNNVVYGGSEAIVTVLSETEIMLTHIDAGNMLVRTPSPGTQTILPDFTRQYTRSAGPFYFGQTHGGTDPGNYPVGRAFLLKNTSMSSNAAIVGFNGFTFNLPAGKQAAIAPGGVITARIVQFRMADLYGDLADA